MPAILLTVNGKPGEPDEISVLWTFVVNGDPPQVGVWQHEPRPRRRHSRGIHCHDRGVGKIDIYKGLDAKEVSAYPISEVARYLMLPKSTLRSWVIGQPYTTKGGERFFEPLIQIADRDAGMMSFMDLVEAHVLSALRRQHRVKLETIREAVKRIRERTANASCPPLSPTHPLADYQFATIGVTLFVEELGRLVNLSQNNQLGLRECLEGYLKRIEREPITGLAARLYPFTRAPATTDAPRTVVIDPRIAFGRPVISGTNIKTELVAERFLAGESPDDLSEDYNVPINAINEALRWEHRPAA